MLCCRSGIHIDPVTGRRNLPKKRMKCNGDADAAKGCWDQLVVRQKEQTLKGQCLLVCLEEGK